MSDDELSVKIANVNLRVPICGDRATTHAIAAAIQDRVGEIEAASTRIDTTAFALRAAYEFAADLYRLRQEQLKSEEQVVNTLAEITHRIAQAAHGLEGP